MNPTPNQITECEDEKQLCEWAAVYCMGWTVRDSRDSSMSRFVRRTLITQIGDIHELASYQPTSPTEKGKSQCWDLAVKYHCWPRLRNGKYVVFVDDKTEVEHEDHQIAVVKAALLCALGD